MRGVYSWITILHLCANGCGCVCVCKYIIFYVYHNIPLRTDTCSCFAKYLLAYILYISFIYALFIVADISKIVIHKCNPHSISCTVMDNCVIQKKKKQKEKYVQRCSHVQFAVCVMSKRSTNVKFSVLICNYFTYKETIFSE